MPPPDGFRTFLVLWATQSASVIGSQVTFFAINIWLTQSLYPEPSQRAQLAAALGANGLAYALPMVLGTPLAGAWADRHDRRRIMIAANLAATALSTALIVLIAGGALTLPWLVAIMLGYGFAGSCHQASFDTGYALLVPRDQLPRANGMMATTFGLAGLVSPGLGALLLSLPGLARSGHWGGPLALLGQVRHGAAVAIVADAATFLAAAAILVRLRLPQAARHPSRAAASLWSDIREGFAFLLGQHALLVLVALFAAANLAFAFFSVLLPLFLKFELAADWSARHLTLESALALIATVGGLGGVVGGVLMSAWGGLRRRRAPAVLVPLAVMGAGLAALGFVRTVPLAAACLALIEGVVPFANAHSLAIWQTRTPHELQGRVLAARRLVAQGTFPLGTAIAGAIGAGLGAAPAFILFGALLAIFAAALLFDRKLAEAAG